MYKYYQTKEKSHWIPVPFTDDTEELVRGQKAKRLTILAVNELVDDDTTDKHNLSYKGPLYFDIDSKDLQEAIDSGAKLAQHLIKMGVPKETVQIFASGSKGIHILVDERCFYSGRAMKKLPLVYKEMAMALYVPGMDFQVYSQGKGVAWRLTNVKRDDGNYRVQVSIDELADLTPEKYRELCSLPRDDVEFPEPKIVQVPELQVLFEAARKRVNAKPKTVIAVSEGELKKIGASPPACVQELASYKSLHTDKNFNQAAMQMAIYLARSGVSEEMAESLMELMAENSHSTKYDTARSRLEHLQGQLAYIRSTNTYSFGCNAMRDLLKVRPCEGCPIEKEGDTAADEAADANIVKREDGYYVIGEKQDRKVSTFVLDPIDVFMEQPQDGSTPRRTGTVVDIKKSGERVATVTLTENAWTGRSAFIREVEGISNLIFLGNDADVQRIKLLTYEEGQDMGEIMQVYTCGIHIHHVGDRPVFTYVEPGLSVNQLNVTGTHKLQGNVIAPPYFKETEMCKKGDKEAEEAIVNLLKANSPQQIAMIVGWFVACHLKMHLKTLYNQFPVLNIWGNAGSGKSATAGLVSWLNGTDYMMRDTGINVSSITPYAAIEYCSSTTTVPRIMEEFNRSKMTQKNFNLVGEMLKASWNSEAILRGTLGGRTSAGRTGATTTEIPITGPLLAISEQGFEMPALLERSVQVMLSKNTRAGRKDFFAAANKGRKKLREIGKVLMIRALTSSLDDVEAIINEAEGLIPEAIDDRPRYSLMVIYLGLTFLKRVLMEDLEFSNEVEDQINLITNQFLEHAYEVGKSTSEALAHTEVDTVVETMALIAAISKQDTGKSSIFLEAGTHYLVMDDALLIDVPLCHAIYKKYVVQQERSNPAIASAKQFKILLQEEMYYVEECTAGHFASGRPVAKLSLAKMDEKGIDVSLFMMD